MYFYKYVPAQYVEIRRFARKIICVINTYKCVQQISLINSNNQFRVRSRLTNINLNSVLNEALRKYMLDIVNIKKKILIWVFLFVI